MRTFVRWTPVEVFASIYLGDCIIVSPRGFITIFMEMIQYQLVLLAKTFFSPFTAQWSGGVRQRRTMMLIERRLRKLVAINYTGNVRSGGLRWILMSGCCVPCGAFHSTIFHASPAVWTSMMMVNLRPHQKCEAKFAIHRMRWNFWNLSWQIGLGETWFYCFELVIESRAVPNDVALFFFSGSYFLDGENNNEEWR